MTSYLRKNKFLELQFSRNLWLSPYHTFHASNYFHYWVFEELGLLLNHVCTFFNFWNCSLAPMLPFQQIKLGQFSGHFIGDWVNILEKFLWDSYTIDIWKNNFLGHFRPSYSVFSDLKIKNQYFLKLGRCGCSLCNFPIFEKSEFLFL